MDKAVIFGKTESMTERDRWGLRGPVHVCRLQRTWPSRRCSENTCEIEARGDISIVEFRLDGSLASRWHQNPDGSGWQTTYDYDHTPRLVAMRTKNSFELFNLQIYDYDDAGRLTRVIERTQSGGDRVVESYRYSSIGRKIKTLHIDLAAQRPNTQYAWGVEGTDSTYSTRGAVTLTTLYNERDQPAEVLFCDGTGGALSRVEFRYDLDGNLIEETQTNTAETLPPEMLSTLNRAQLEMLRGLLGAGGKPIRRVHRYDERGRRVQTSSQHGPLGGNSKTTAYNDHGDPIEEVFERDEREYNVDEEGRLSGVPTRESASRSEARFCYQYDAHGNWVMKTVESRIGTANDFVTASVEQRTISYFG